ncbi:MAG: TIGR03560 family F420-dependent LLM class oxidoreductase [Candidatus Heimdallarchaeota archaeon]|nr:TIGR03560 family F420-dependent LLM class oxidoreductase [Candidatus Heimdallarchaeota archaeon]
MKLGIQIPNFSYPKGISESLDEIVPLIDNGGFYSLWVMDHYYQIQNLFGLDYTEPMMEGYSVLNYFAGLTKKVKLGTLVTGVIYRNPAFLIKQVSTLDVLSKGRAYMGIGAAWYKEEAEAYNFPFPPIKERFEMLEETLQIAKKMFSEDRGSYEGKHYRVNDLLNSPQSIQRPHPKIMIGGMGEKKTLRMVAQYADTTNLFASVGVDVLKHKLKVLEQHCVALKRDFNEIEKTTLGTVNLTKSSANDLIAELKALNSIGIEHAILNIPNIHELKPIDVLRDEVMPAIADL